MAVPLIFKTIEETGISTWGRWNNPDDRKGTRDYIQASGGSDAWRDNGSTSDADTARSVWFLDAAQDGSANVDDLSALYGTTWSGGTEDSGTIFKISPDRQIFVFATLEASISAYHLAMGPDGYLYVTGPTTSSFDSVYRISHAGASPPNDT